MQDTAPQGAFMSAQVTQGRGQRTPVQASQPRQDSFSELAVNWTKVQLEPWKEIQLASEEQPMEGALGTQESLQ